MRRRGPLRYCAKCGRYVGYRWQEYVLCRVCLVAGISYAMDKHETRRANLESPEGATDDAPK